MAKKEKRIQHRTELLQSITYDIVMPMRRIETIKTVDADLLNISNSGVCIKTKWANETGSVVRLKLPHHGTDILVPSLAEVKWVSPANDKFKMGLQFLM
jgi:hypothetical protein